MVGLPPVQRQAGGCLRALGASRRIHQVHLFRAGRNSCSRQGLVVLRLSLWVMAAGVITQCNYRIANDLLRLFVEQLYSTNSGFYKWGLVSVVINQITCFALYFQHIQFATQKDKLIVITGLFLLLKVAMVKCTSNDLTFEILQNFSQLPEEANWPACHEPCCLQEPHTLCCRRTARSL